MGDIERRVLWAYLDQAGEGEVQYSVFDDFMAHMRVPTNFWVMYVEVPVPPAPHRRDLPMQGHARGLSLEHGRQRSPILLADPARQSWCVQESCRASRCPCNGHSYQPH